MDTKRTPGPWTSVTRLSGSENHHGFYIVSERDYSLCDVMPVDQDGIEGGANARLIAAAPELLEALREALPFIATIARENEGMLGGVTAGKVLAAIESAIAKVENS